MCWDGEDGVAGPHGIDYSQMGSDAGIVDYDDADSVPVIRDMPLEDKLVEMLNGMLKRDQAGVSAMFRAQFPVHIEVGADCDHAVVYDNGIDGTISALTLLQSFVLLTGSKLNLLPVYTDSGLIREFTIHATDHGASDPAHDGKIP